jgi:photosystem II stability/assembly factor-like uncharacterized protein
VRVPHNIAASSRCVGLRAQHEPFSLLSLYASVRAPSYTSQQMRSSFLLLALTLATTQAASFALAQWDIEESHTTASLRGIHNVGGGVTWASGTDGTVLRTEDGGYLWQTCSIPPGAEKLDFRGVQAFDENTAIVMSSGPGDQSRLYKTTDGCQTWKLVFTNPDGPKDGFFDALLFIDSNHGLVFGDPAHGGDRNPVEGGYFAFRIRVTHDGGKTWTPVSDPEVNSPGKNLMPVGTEGLFAASNSSAAVSDGLLWIGTGGGRVLRRRLYTNPSDEVLSFQSLYCAGAIDPISHACGIPWVDWKNTKTPLSGTGQAAGIFSLVFRTPKVGIAVGGDYQKPDQSMSNAAFSFDGGDTWQPAITPPRGYRSSVAHNDKQNLWITVGPNGTDISTDDGKNWRPLTPSGTDPADADKNWNALSLPFVVGPHGRIGHLRTIDQKAAVTKKP